jgi:hypothetical protein
VVLINRGKKKKEREREREKEGKPATSDQVQS